MKNIAFLFILFSGLASAGKVVTTEVKGKVESLIATTKNEKYRVTIHGFARVLHTNTKEKHFNCIEIATKEECEIKLTVDLNGNVLSCEPNK